MNTTQLIEGLENLAPFIADLALKGGALSLLGLAVYASLRKASAAVRHGALLAVAIGMLTLPLLSLVPQWGVLPAPAEAQPRAKVGVATPTPASPSTLIATRPVEAELVVASADAISTADNTEPIAPPVSEPARSFSWPLAVGTAWLFGVVMFGMAIVAGHIAVRFAQRRCRVVREGAVFDALRRACDEYGLGWMPRLLLSDRHAMPMTWGLWRATVVLPAEAERWDADRLRIVMLHELAHVGRRDNAALCIAHAARALHWFNPLVWWINRLMVLERERACDDCVVNAGQRPADYAEHLLQIAAHWQDRAPMPHAAIAMARRNQLEGRLVGILSPRNRRALTRGAALAVVLIALAIVVPVGIVGPRQSADARPYGSTEPQGPETLAVVEKLTGAWVIDTRRSENFGHVRRLVISPDGSITRYEWPDSKTQADAQRFNDRYTLAGLDQVHVTGPWGEQQFKLRVHPDGQHMIWLTTDARFVFTRTVEAVPPGYVGSWDVSNDDIMTIHADGMVTVKYGNGFPTMNGWIKDPERKLITGPDGDPQHAGPGYRFLIIGPDGDPQYAIDAVGDQLRIANPKNTEESALVSRITRGHVPGGASEKEPQPSYVGAWRLGDKYIVMIAPNGIVSFVGVESGKVSRGLLERKGGRVLLTDTEGKTNFLVEVVGSHMELQHPEDEEEVLFLYRVKPDSRYVGVWDSGSITGSLSKDYTRVFVHLKANATYTLTAEGPDANKPIRGVWDSEDSVLNLIDFDDGLPITSAVLVDGQLRLSFKPDGHTATLRPIKTNASELVDPSDPFAGDMHPMYRVDLAYDSEDVFEQRKHGVMLDLETGRTLSFEDWQTKLDADARQAYDLHVVENAMRRPPGGSQRLMHFLEANSFSEAGRLAVKFIDSLRMSRSTSAGAGHSHFYAAVLTDSGYLAIVHRARLNQSASTCQWSLGKITDLPDGSIAVTPIKLVKPKPEPNAPVDDAPGDASTVEDVSRAER